jgi:hypothetical protein
MLNIMNQEKKIHKLEYDDFAKSFGESAVDFSNSLKEKIDSLNFNYRFPSNEENESLILEALLKIDTDKQVIGAKERDEVWFKGWDENLKLYRESGYSEESLTPKFVRPGNPIRLNKQFILPEDDNFELNFIEVYRHWYIEKYFKNVDDIHEFGCGTGFNLLHINKILPDKKLFGSDFVQSSVDLVNEIARQKNIDLVGQIFNMLNPDDSYHISSNSALYTFGSLEQLASELDPILNFFISKNPKICIHTEPAIEMYEDNSLIDYLGRKFQGKRGYSSGLISKLKQMESDGKIEIIKIKRLYFGSYFMEGYNMMVWRPKL